MKCANAGCEERAVWLMRWLPIKSCGCSSVEVSTDHSDETGWCHQHLVSRFTGTRHCRGCKKNVADKFVDVESLVRIP